MYTSIISFIRKKFLCANALVQGETGLTFDGPFRWKSEYTQFLYRQGRFEPITISSLSEKGLQYPYYSIALLIANNYMMVLTAIILYCFINPKEIVKSLLPSCKPWAPCPDGGIFLIG